jgi:hypothetical protein
MRYGHRQAQDMFAEVGRTLGYRVKRSYSPSTPTDGIWLIRAPHVGELPVAAMEVIVSESPKTLRGSLHTLETVSPSLGILLLQTDEITRGVIRNGGTATTGGKLLARMQATLGELVSRSRHRVEVWHFEHLVHVYMAVTGNRSLLVAA